MADGARTPEQPGQLLDHDIRTDCRHGLRCGEMLTHTYQVLLMLDGKTQTLNVASSWTERDVKSALSAKAGCSLGAECYFVAGGRLLNDVTTLGQLGVGQASLVDLRYRSRGGGCVASIGKPVDDDAPLSKKKGEGPSTNATAAMHATGPKEGTSWLKLGGDRFDQLLGDGTGAAAVRLIDAEFLVQLADGRFGGRIIRRQDLPEEAFINPTALRSMEHFKDALRIFVVSYPWLQPDQPDPHGFTLQHLAAVLKARLQKNIEKYGGGTVAVFLDFMSLFQHGVTASRTDEENELFFMALREMSACKAGLKCRQTP